MKYSNGKESKVKRKLLMLVCGVVVLLSGLVPVASAQQTAGQGLEISPPLIDRSVNPGQNLELTIRLRNVTKSTLITEGSIEDFTSGGEEGQPKLLLDQKSTDQSPYTFKPWVKSISKVTLVPNEAKTVSVVVNVPANASPGGHYGVIRFSALPPELEGTGVSLSASIGTLVLFNVSGNVVKKASVAEFSTSQNGKKGSFFEKGPVDFLLRVKNDGNVHFKPTGTIRITNSLGKEVAVQSINQNGGNILPQSIRKFDTKLDKKPLFGRYKAEARVQYGGEELTKSISFWIIPYKLIAIILGIIILIGFFGRRGLKRYNQHIIKQSKKSGKK